MNARADHLHTTNGLTFRPARKDDGAALWELVRSAGTLELNSAYFYLLFATDFGDTCLVAEHDNKMVGAVIGYRPPKDASAAFVWQIGLAPDRQGKGLGTKLLAAWLELPANKDATWVTATVAEDNTASQRLFEGFARKSGVACDITEHFTSQLFPHEHSPEQLFRIGPIDRAS